jgi:hypothetical protein
MTSMTPETEMHLRDVERAIAAAKALLSKHGYPDDLRTVIVAGLIDIMIEHHESMVLLIRSGKIGSVFALLRSVVESMYRGLWLNYCATDAEVMRFEAKDDIPLTLGQMAEAIDDKYRADGFYVDFKKRSWGALNSYTHSGVLQLGRRFTGHELKPAYTDEQVFEATTTATTCVLLLVSRFFVAHNFGDESKETDQLIESYGPAPRNQSVGRP